MINCQFSNPVYWDFKNLILKPLDKDIGGTWAFSEMICESDLDNSTSTLPGYLELIENEGGSSSFILDKKISYGDFLLTSFLILLLLGLTVFGIRDFVKNRKLERL